MVGEGLFLFLIAIFAEKLFWFIFGFTILVALFYIFLIYKFSKK